MSALPTTRAPVAVADQAHPTLPRLGSLPGAVLAPLDAVAAAAVLVAATAVDGIHPGAAALLFVPLWIASVALCGDYHLPGDRAARSRRLFRAALTLTAVAFAASSATVGGPAPTSVLVACVTAALLGNVGRGGIELLTGHGVALPGLSHRVVVAGRDRTVREFLLHLADHPEPGLEVVGACLVGPVDGQDLGLPCVLGIARCADTAGELGADGVVVLPDVAVDVAATRRLQWQLAQVRAWMFVWPGVVDVAADRTCLHSTHGLGLVHLRAPRIDGAAHRLKDALEPLLACALGIAVLPLVGLLALAVRLDSTGPAFFRQVRIGRDGTPFTMWKLRTMRIEAEREQHLLRTADEGSGPLFKIREDPRTTRVGRWLRRTSLDELPQLLNVVRGEMSLVGPRPALPDEVSTYDADTRRRLAVRPGITGLWQVSGRSELSWRESVRLDQYYVDNWSPTADVVLLLRTVSAVLRRRGAY